MRIIDDFTSLYRNLNGQNTHLLRELYRDDVHFVDPFHVVDGIDNLERYFRNMYENVTNCEFNFEEHLADSRFGFVSWTMRLRHPRLNRGQEVLIPGTSLIRFDDCIYYHRDYFDAGQLLYENVPVLGPVVRTLKRRMKAAS